MIDADLRPWPAIRSQLPPNYLGLLLGNGASRAIWDDFRYQNLYDQACDQRRPKHLTDEDKEIFKNYGDGGNFEAVLSGLWTAKVIGEILAGRDTDRIVQRYESIKAALFQTINDIHVPHASVPEATKQELREELLNYDRVYTTNYDLLGYWSTVGIKDIFKDFFWGKGNEFDIDDTDVWDVAGYGTPTKVYYLHGAIHICADSIARRTWKKTAGMGGAILGQFDQHPLLVSEGTWKAKRSQILSNDYLGFCYNTLGRHRGSMVIFGHSLTEQFDMHIVNAINKTEDDTPSTPVPRHRKKIAYSMLPSADSYHILSEKARIAKLFKDHEVLFFDALTHPLGSSALRINAGR